MAQFGALSQSFGAMNRAISSSKMVAIAPMAQFFTPNQRWIRGRPSRLIWLSLCSFAHSRATTGSQRGRPRPAIRGGNLSGVCETIRHIVLSE
jgi:hypothetical protein